MNQYLDVAWILVCAALVMLMQAGFSCLESGLVRSKNSINVAAKNFADFCVSSVVFWLFGFALMFGATSGGFFGTSGFLFNDTTNPWLMAFFIFQLGFCGTAVTIVSGAVSERMRFAGYLVVATIISALIYPFIGHWVWGSAGGAASGGWLEQRGFIDFAGSTVVHSVGGWVSLAAIIIIGPRIGRFGKNAVPIHGHDLPFVTLGVFLLWFGWFGFNGGSTLGLTPEVPTIIVNTTVSGAFGGVVAMVLAWRLGGRPDVAMIMNGSLAGLVGITASAHIMTPLAAAGIGSIAAVFMYAVTMLLERYEIDDVVGAVPVHLAAGIWGTLAVAIFGDPEGWGTGLSRFEQLGVQATGVGTAFAWAFGVGFALLWLINRWFPLRIDPDGERSGLNIAEHGASTEILDLLNDMDRQRQNGDFSQHVGVEPHTEIGQIARQYNRVLDEINAESAKREAVTQALRQQTASLQLLQGAASAANKAKSIENAIQLCLESICEFGGWPVGHAYMVAEDGTGELLSSKIWHLDDPERFVALRDVSDTHRLGPGPGLAGRTLASATPTWIVDVTGDPTFRRAKWASDIGVKAGFAFPVLVGEEVVAVLEFFSTEARDPDETILEVMGAVGTQLGRVVERVRSETARFNSLIDNMPANVFLRDKDGRFILVNRNYEKFYEVTNDSVCGKTPNEVDGNQTLRQMAEEFTTADHEVIEKNTAIEREYNVLSAGEYHTMIDRTFPITDASGEVIAVGGVEIDITDRKRAEEALAEKETQLRLALDSMPGGMRLVDRDLKNVLFNARYGALCNYPDDLLEVGGSMYDEVGYQVERGDFGPGDADELIEQVAGRYRHGEATSVERNIPGGPTLQIDIAPTSEGGYVSILTDITERKKGEEQLRVAKEQAERAFHELTEAQESLIRAQKMASLGELTAGIAHEIKNPLNFVNNFSETAAELADEIKDRLGSSIAELDEKNRASVTSLFEDLDSDLSKVGHHGRRADSIVKSMLLHARGDTGERETIDLNGLVEESLNLAYHSERARSGDFNVDLVKDFDRAIRPIDLVPQEISRVLVNLISNGFYAIQEQRKLACEPPGYEPALTVATRNLGEWVEIAIRDNGIGMSQDTAENVFTPFFTTKPAGEGTGLGLSLSYKIISEQYHGDIQVDSGEGRGTTFTVRLPYTPEETSASAGGASA